MKHYDKITKRFKGLTYRFHNYLLQLPFGRYTLNSNFLRPTVLFPLVSTVALFLFSAFFIERLIQLIKKRLTPSRTFLICLVILRLPSSTTHQTNPIVVYALLQNGSEASSPLLKHILYLLSLLFSFLFSLTFFLQKILLLLHNCVSCFRVFHFAFCVYVFVSLF